MAPITPNYCRHYQQGRCNQADCKFSHDCPGSKAFCNHWVNHRCNRGNACRFVHGTEDERQEILQERSRPSISTQPRQSPYYPAPNPAPPPTFYYLAPPPGLGHPNFPPHHYNHSNSPPAHNLFMGAPVPIRTPDNSEQYNYPLTPYYQRPGLAVQDPMQYHHSSPAHEQFPVTSAPLQARVAHAETQYEHPPVHTQIPAAPVSVQTQRARSAPEDTHSSPYYPPVAVVGPIAVGLKTTRCPTLDRDATCQQAYDTCPYSHEQWKDEYFNRLCPVLKKKGVCDSRGVACPYRIHELPASKPIDEKPEHELEQPSSNLAPAKKTPVIVNGTYPSHPGNSGGKNNKEWKEALRGRSDAASVGCGSEKYDSGISIKSSATDPKPCAKYTKRVQDWVDTVQHEQSKDGR